ncbi:actin-binding ADF family protein [Streptomyces sp. NPDC059385]|uniref:actin-binding ADF family protein n=1 Tax=Streptomyces sp. NPDC059385 TaxID=3346817 RepID=UPI003691585C
MSSGVTINDEAMKAARELKAYGACRFVTFKLSADFSEFVVAEKGERGASYDDFLASLPADEPRFALYSFETTAGGGRKFEKLVFIAWKPESSPVRQKMLYATSAQDFKMALDIASGVEIRATDTDEISLKAVEARIISSTTG